jgi:hypothetical protein
MLPRLFPAGFLVRDHERVPLPALRRALSRRAAQCDLIAVERNRLLEPWPGYRRLPPGVRMVLDLRTDAPLDAHARYYRKKAVDQVAEAGVRFEDVDPAGREGWLRRFYDELYAPHVAARFGSASLESFAQMRVLWGRGPLRLAFHEGRLIAGSLFTVEADTLVFCKYGVRDPRNPLHRAAASIYLHFDYARSRGYAAYDAFHARPFFEDGVFAHKRLCGLGVRPEESGWYWDEDLLMRIVAASPAILEFLQAQPFLHVESDGGLVANLCVAGEARLTSAVAREYRRRRTPGIARYDFLVPHLPNDAQRAEIARACGPGADRIGYRTIAGVAEPRS